MAAGDIVEGMASAARANHVPFVHKETVDALSAKRERAKSGQETAGDKKPAACTMQQKGARADVEREVQSALAALQSAGEGSKLPRTLSHQYTF